jgi:hypothetical protein
MRLSMILALHEKKNYCNQAIFDRDTGILLTLKQQSTTKMGLCDVLCCNKNKTNSCKCHIM